MTATKAQMPPIAIPIPTVPNPIIIFSLLVRSRIPRRSPELHFGTDNFESALGDLVYGVSVIRRYCCEYCFVAARTDDFGDFEVEHYLSFFSFLKCL